MEKTKQEIIDQAHRESRNDEEFVHRYNELFYERYKDADQIICSTETGEVIGALYINMICNSYKEKEIKRFFAKLAAEMEEDDRL